MTQPDSSSVPVPSPTPPASSFVESKELKECVNCKRMVPVNCCHWPCYPSPASETLDVEKLTALFGRLARLYLHKAERNAGKGFECEGGDLAAQQAEASAACSWVAAALPSLLRAQTRVEELEAEQNDPAYLYAGGRIQRVAIECRNEELGTLYDKLNAAKSALSQAQTERDALRRALEALPGEGLVEAIDRVLTDRTVRLAQVLEERDELRAQVSALEAAQRECAARVTALPSELMHDDSGEQMRFLSRPAVLEALAPVLHTTPTQP